MEQNVTYLVRLSSGIVVLARFRPDDTLLILDSCRNEPLEKKASWARHVQTHIMPAVSHLPSQLPAENEKFVFIDTNGRFQIGLFGDDIVSIYDACIDRFVEMGPWTDNVLAWGEINV